MTLLSQAKHESPERSMNSVVPSEARTCHPESRVFQRGVGIYFLIQATLLVAGNPFTTVSSASPVLK